MRRATRLITFCIIQNNVFIWLCTNYVYDILYAETESFGDECAGTEQKLKIQEKKLIQHTICTILKGINFKYDGRPKNFTTKLQAIALNASIEPFRYLRAKQLSRVNSRPEICCAVLILKQKRKNKFYTTRPIGILISTKLLPILWISSIKIFKIFKHISIQ